MRVLMFQRRFIDRIKSGSKIHTIRRAGSLHTRPGHELSLRYWTGDPYRSKQKEITVVRACFVAEIEITRLEGILLNGQRLTTDEREALAVGDGFRDRTEMRRWFAETHKLPFTGDLIAWNYCSALGRIWMTKAQVQLMMQHGTPSAFRNACADALGEISHEEFSAAVQKYDEEWQAAGRLP